MEGEFLDASLALRRCRKAEELEVARRLAEEAQAREKAERERAEQAQAREKAERERAEQAELWGSEKAENVRRLRQRLWVIRGVMTAALIAAGIAMYFSYHATEKSKIAESRRLAALSRAERDKRLDRRSSPGGRGS